MDKEIMSNLQKQFNKVNRKIQILNNEVDRLKRERDEKLAAENNYNRRDATTSTSNLMC